MAIKLANKTKPFTLIADISCPVKIFTCAIISSRILFMVHSLPKKVFLWHDLVNRWWRKEGGVFKCPPRSYCPPSRRSVQLCC